MMSAAPPAASARAARFRGMVAQFGEHSSADIDCVRDARFRELLHSVHGAIDDDAVVTAFEILYEDFAPIRIGGDLIFRKVCVSVVRFVV